ncbi:uncharacterized protein LOC115209536 [Octopus sinensis]|uniref:Uncharacterized protein LOC115209536 n=1 Tax=Octopus sinensis TaxID=2607531 RepID=A0A6P7S6D4_9MOLL|nr:uncharacterized protein LOC115209536 [Octopus sinensis]
MHLIPNITDAEVHIPGYAVFHTDRRERSHSVVAMYIREDVTPLVLLSLSNSKQPQYNIVGQWNGSLTTDPEGISEVLSKQFKSVFTPCPLDTCRLKNPAEFFNIAALKWEGPIIDYINIEETDITASIDEISSSSVTGSNGFPAILLNLCKQALMKPLQILFQSFLANGKLPKKLKEGIICPIHKGGSRAEAQNYRPISLASHISKVMECTIRKKVIMFLEENDLLNNTQHGFHPERTCFTQLQQHYDGVLKQQLDH